MARLLIGCKPARGRFSSRILLARLHDFICSYTAVMAANTKQQGSRKNSTKAANPSVLTIRVDGEFKKRLNMALASEGTKLQTKGVELLEQYVESVERSVSEHDRRMRIARKQLNRYRRTFEELAK